MSTVALHRIARRRERHFDDRVLWCFEDRPQNSYQMFAESVTRAPDKIAFIFEDTVWSYRRLEAEVLRLSAGLHAIGIGQGDRVALWLSNRLTFVTLFLAIQRLGAVAVPLDVRLQHAEVGHALALCDAAALFFDADLADRLPPTVSTKAIPVAQDNDLFTDLALSDAPPMAEPAEDDAAVILFTSGTTGTPKGAILSHLNIVHSTIHHAGNLGLGAEDRSLVAVPLSHVTGIICAIMAPLWTGGTLILMARFKARAFLEAASHWRMTYTIMVPAMYALCLRDEGFDQADLGDWRLGHYGASPMPAETLRILAQKLPGLTLVNGYGATETCSPAMMSPVECGQRTQEAAMRALPCVECLVVDPETGVERPVGTSGELWIRGPNVSPGYWGDAEATARGFVAGFWRSGDIGQVDTQGNFVILDRLKDVINRGGYKIYSAEVEAVLSQFPGVEEVAIVGLPDPVLGERVHAVIRSDLRLQPQDLALFCSTRLGDYKLPESWQIVADALPRNSMGKLDKKLLRAMAVACKVKE